jgi:hypothetical protein
VAAHVEDRDIDAADIAEQIDGLLAAGSLLALEAVLQRSAHTDADDRVTIYDKALWTLAQDRFRYLGCSAMAPSSALEPCGRS